jgi:hypothetical protein
MAACAPVKSKPVVLCLNDEGCHAAVVWQVLQSTEIPAAVWLGAWAVLYFVWWQLLHSIEVPAYPAVWQLAQSTVVWAPVSGKLVREWLKVAPSQLFELWHKRQSVGNFEAT